jgi:hypothetical protein
MHPRVLGFPVARREAVRSAVVDCVDRWLRLFKTRQRVNPYFCKNRSASWTLSALCCAMMRAIR